MNLRVTDHALVRFLERAGRLDVEAVRGAIAASVDRAAGAARILGQSEYEIHADGLIYRVRDGAVTTITNNATRSRRG